MTSTLTNAGQISLIIGPMFAGKSTELLRQLNIYCKCYATVFVTNSIDTREYLSHNPIIQTTLKNTSIDYLQCKELNIEELMRYDVIGIDEAQFFGELVKPVIELAKRNKIIVISGLDADSDQNVFLNVVNLIPYSSNVKKLTALCNECIANHNERHISNINVAPMTIRKIQSKERFVVGQEESYSVSCLEHLQRNDDVDNEHTKEYDEEYIAKNENTKNEN